MFYSQELIDQIQQNNDIVDVINEYIPLTKKGANYVCLCPFHADSNPSLTVSRQKQLFKCFACGEGGNVITFLQKYEGKDFKEALETLASRAGIKLPENIDSEYSREKQNHKQRLMECNVEAARYFYMFLRSEGGQKGMEYFKKRQLSEETMKKFGLGFSGLSGSKLIPYLKEKGFTDKEIIDSGLGTFDEKNGLRSKFWNRVMFPIKNQAGKVIAFGGRVMGDGEPKYLNSPETAVFNKSTNLYAFDMAKASRSKYFILCEGYMDVIALHQAGFNMAVASLGTAFTPGQALMLKRYVNDVYLSYDSDGPGIQAIIRAAKICREYALSCKVIDMNPYKDPDEFIKALGHDEYQKRIDEAKNAFIFEIGVIRKKYDPDDPDANTRYAEEVAELLTEIKDEVARTNYIKACAKEMGITVDALSAMVSKQAGKRRAIPENAVLKSGIHNKDKKEDSKVKSEQLMLTYLAEYPSIYTQIKDIVSEEDFTDEPYKEVATKFFADLKEGRADPARMVSLFEDEDIQNQVSDMFTSYLSGIETKEQTETAIADVIRRLKNNRLESLRNENKLTPSENMKFMRQLNELKKIKINLPD
ncbi:MAG: DNA primase [Lachnospiraceae bacterium]|nr:DNA primase [Lachnospiraceae bacterium]